MKHSVNLNYKEVEAHLLEMTRNTVSKLGLNVEDFEIRVLMKLLKQHYQNAQLLEDPSNSRNLVKFTKDPFVDDTVLIARYNEKMDIEVYDSQDEKLFETIYLRR